MAEPYLAQLSALVDDFDGGKIKKEYVILSEQMAAESSQVHQLLELSIRYVGGRVE
jgi:hypothetical protein